MSPLQSAERVSRSDVSDNYVFRRSQLAYRRAADLVSGDVLEIGTGSGYGVEMVSQAASSFLTIDKTEAFGDISHFPNARFRLMRVPPIELPSESFDYVISFQVIEHIKDDRALIGEVRRVLRKGGKFIVTTPNALTSLTRNPWHVREYTPEEFTDLMSGFFSSVEALGVFGNEKVMEYYERNREAVERVERFDILDLQHRLPAWMLRAPYDLLNRLNRQRLLRRNETLTRGISEQDYRLAPVADDCFDLFYICEK
jgi:SAM-dependent methyltransferase